jgi:hypothetical protein
MMKRTVFVVGVLVMVWAVIGLAQGPPPVPTPPDSPVLTEVQKLQLQNAIQKMQLAQAAIQLAQVEFDKSRDSAQALLKGLQVPGYELNLETMTYVKAAPPPVTPKK